MLEQRSETIKSVEARLLGKNYEKNGVEYATRRTEQAEKAGRLLQENPALYKSTALHMPYVKCPAVEENSKRVEYFWAWVDDMLADDIKQEEDNAVELIQEDVIRDEDEAVYLQFMYLDELHPADQVYKTSEVTAYEETYNQHKLNYSKNGKYM